MKTEKSNYRPTHSANLQTETKNLRPSLTDKEPTKKPYYIKDILLRTLIGIHERALKDLQLIVTDYKTLNIGIIVTEDFEKIAAGDLKDIQDRYFKNIEDDIAKLHLSNELIKDNMRSGNDVVFNDFKSKAEINITAFRNKANCYGTHHPQLAVKNYIIKNGEVLFTDANRDYIKTEFCSLFIDSNAKQKFVQLQEQTLKNLIELKAILIENNIGDLFSVPGVSVGMFDEGRNDIVIGDEFVQYIEK